MQNIQLILSLLSFFLFIIVVCDYFLIRDLKRKVKSAMDSYDELSEKYKESELRRSALLDRIRDLQWQLDNPPKYKKGDKIEDLIVVSHAFHKPTLGEIIMKLGDILISKLFFSDKFNKNIASKFSSHYTYKLTNTISGDMQTKTESELIELSKPKQ